MLPRQTKSTPMRSLLDMLLPLLRGRVRGRGNLSIRRASASALVLLVLAGCEMPPEACRVAAKAGLPPSLLEASGVVLTAGGRVWVHADSGEPLLYELDAADRVVRAVRVRDARVGDWEDLAYGPCPAGECLYIGEIGDNLHRRPHREVLRVSVPSEADTTVHAQRFRFRYPDGPSDAEALVALPDESLLVITKGRNRSVGVYRYPAPLRPDSTMVLEHVQDLSDGIVQVPTQVTGAASLGDGRVLVRTYASLHLYRWTGQRLEPLGETVDLRPLREAQGEGVGAAADGAVVLVSEGVDGGSLVRLQCDWAR